MRLWRVTSSVVKYPFLRRLSLMCNSGIALTGSIIAHDNAVIGMSGGVNRLAGDEALRRRRDNPQRRARPELDVVIDGVTEMGGTADRA